MKFVKILSVLSSFFKLLAKIRKKSTSSHILLAQPVYTAISIKVVHEQSGKVEYERERLLGTALKIN
jgi:hypothetical protein